MNKQEIINKVDHQGRIAFEDIRPGDTVLWLRRGQAVISQVVKVIGSYNPYWVNPNGNPVNPESREFYLVDRPFIDLGKLSVFSVIRFKNHSGVAAVGMMDRQGNWNIIDEHGQRYNGSSCEIMNQQPYHLEVMN